MRKELPVYMQETEILDSIENNLVTIICGETGSGKSTQVPQFCYEYGYSGSTRPGMIGITQPRRVAATALAKRISEELNYELGQQVGYQIRYDKKFMTENTKIKLMTDGLLLKELELDFLLNKYSLIIIDEAHERSVNTDILISLLTRIVKIRLQLSLQERLSEPATQSRKYHPLRLVIMSATLRVADFMENKRLFPVANEKSELVQKPRLIKIESRQYPVSIHFSKVTKEDYQEETFKKVVKIHKTLPPGHILVFMTGRQEIQVMIERLKIELGEAKTKADGQSDSDESMHSGDEKSGGDEGEDSSDESYKMPAQILPLYSMLAPEQQMKVFEPPKEGHRLIVVSTNIAETSITIPNIRYVVD